MSTRGVQEENDQTVHVPTVTAAAGRFDSLPQLLTPFVGRERHLAAVDRLLRDSRVPLLTLTGPGGVGKTRLAIESAERAADEFSDGTVFVPLAAVVDPALVLPSIAAAMDVDNSGERPLADRLATVLTDRDVLLVVDNFEQVIEAGFVVADLLNSAPDLTVLVTSRAPLRIAGEQEYPVTPLELPDLSHDLMPERVVRSEAVTLFVNRARSVRPSFTVTAENAPAITQICRNLEGLPLALELAASRVKVLSVEELLQRLQSQLFVLTGGPQNSPERQRTMRETIAWSYRLLSPEYQDLFRRLSVFRGGFTLAAAEQVFGSDSIQDSTGGAVATRKVRDDPVHILEGFSVLADQSLIERDDSNGAESRFRMLETIREFGLEQLFDRGEEAQVCRRFADYWLAEAEAVWEVKFHLETFYRALDRLESDHDNLRAALDWLEEYDTDGALELAGALFWFWYVRGHQSEGLERLRRALSLPNGEFTPRWQARAQTSAAALSQFQGQVDEARQLAEVALAGWRKLGDDLGIGFSLFVLGVIAEDNGEYELARPLLEDAIPHMVAGGDLSSVGSLRYHLAVVAFGRGDLDESQAILTSVLADSDAPHHRILPWAVHLRGLVAYARGQPEMALPDLQESLRHFRSAGAAAGFAEPLAGIAAVVATWDRELASRLFGAVDRLSEEWGTAPALPESAVYEEAAAHLKDQLGAGAFAREQDVGRNWPLERAMEEALTFVPPSSLETDSDAMPGGLSQREAEVLRLVAAGWTNDQIGEALSLSPRTVQTHLTNIYRKIDVSRRSEAVRFAIDHQLA